jgi:hypothetical protein
MKCFSRRALTVLALTAGVGVLAAVPAVAAAKTNVRCVGSADFCGAKVSIAGGASNRIVTIGLPSTNLKLVGVSAIPVKSRGAFGISKAAFRVGGSQCRFTRSAVRSNPRGARIILLFAAGNAVTPSPRPGGSLGLDQEKNALFSVGTGMTVSIVGGGGGTSNCTSNETNTTFTTKGDNEPHPFGFDTRGSGSCAFEPSWSYFKVSVKAPGGTVIGSGSLYLGDVWPFAEYKAQCGSFDQGLSCTKSSEGLKITRR